MIERAGVGAREGGRVATLDNDWAGGKWLGSPGVNTAEDECSWRTMWKVVGSRVESQELVGKLCGTAGSGGMRSKTV
eukprot:14290324-Alexandrium_andersonii.AAC.1